MIAAAVDDLMFLSRIREAARRHGTVVRGVRTAADVMTACREGARSVIVDLDTSRLPALEIVAAVAADASFNGVELVGYYSHVETERAREAKAAGCRLVLPRSAFVRQLDDLLR